MTTSPEPTAADGSPPAEATERVTIIRWIVVGIVVWGSLHAVGAWSFNHNPLRAVVVLACVAGFLGFWMTMLAVRQRRLRQRR